MLTVDEAQEAAQWTDDKMARADHDRRNGQVGVAEMFEPASLDDVQAFAQQYPRPIPCREDTPAATGFAVWHPRHGWFGLHSTHGFRGIAVFRTLNEAAFETGNYFDKDPEVVFVPVAIGVPLEQLVKQE